MRMALMIVLSFVFVTTTFAQEVKTVYDRKTSQFVSVVKDAQPSAKKDEKGVVIPLLEKGESTTEAILIEAERDHEVEASTRTRGGLLFRNNTGKDFAVIVHVYDGIKPRDVDLGVLGAGSDMTLPCTKDFISLTFKRGWGLFSDKRPVRKDCGPDPRKTYGPFLVEPHT